MGDRIYWIALIASIFLITQFKCQTLWAADMQVDVPCSDESKADDPNNPSDLKGKPEFGQKSCGTTPTTGVKGQVKKNLELMLGHIIKLYYDGYLINFSDTNDPKNKNAGFCKIKAITQPVCEIQKGEIAQNNYTTGSNGKCGFKPTSLSGLQNVNLDACFKSIPTDLTACGSPLYNFVEAEMAQITTDRDQVKQKLDAATDPGVKATFQAAYDGFNSILTKPDSKDAYLISIWSSYAAQGNSEYCLFRRNGMDEQTCGKELAWIRGFRVSFWKQNLQKVEDEIDSGKLTIVDHGNNALPCKPISDAIDALLNGNGSNALGIRQVESKIRDKWGVVETALDTDRETGALGVESSEIGTAGDAINLSQSKINQNYTTGTGGVEKVDKHVSNAVMSLGLARRRVESLFTKLAHCEVMERTKKDLSTLMKAGNGGIFGRMKKEVIDPCTQYAQAQASSESDGWNRFYQCYQAGAGGIGNVQKFFQAVSKENFTYDPSREPQVQSLKTRDRAVATDNGYQIVSGGQEIPIATVPFCKDLSGFDPTLPGAAN